LACFTLDNDSNGGIVIAGTTPVEMASGLNYYMRNYLNMSVAWERTGGRTTYNISNSIPAVKPVLVKRRGQYSYYANVVTVSYSMVCWLNAMGACWHRRIL
jgi:alpha-N-acetylglucosaminidase